jgi:ABC-type sugar transport system ATPase subunit
MAGKTVVMQSGRIEQIGAPLDLYDYPDNLLVATFTGSPAMNLIEGTIESQGGDGGRRLSWRSVANHPSASLDRIGGKSVPLAGCAIRFRMLPKGQQKEFAVAKAELRGSMRCIPLRIVSPYPSSSPITTMPAS